MNKNQTLKTVSIVVAVAIIVSIALSFYNVGPKESPPTLSSTTPSSLPPAEVITTWAYPDSATVSGTIHIGAVAYHRRGVNRVEFTLNGQTTSITQETMNPETNEMEWVLQVDTTKLTDDTPYTITATAYPNAPPPENSPTDLPPLIIQVDNSPDYNSIYVDKINGDDNNPGTQSNPLRTIEKALINANSGDTIYLMNGDYTLADMNSRVTWPTNSLDFTKYTTITPAPGHNPRIIEGKSGVAISFLKFKNINFDLRGLQCPCDHNNDIFKVYSHEKSHYWFDNVRFMGPESDNAYPENSMKGIAIQSNVGHILIENSYFSNIGNNMEFSGEGDGWSIARNNELEKTRNDIFIIHSDFPGKVDNILITGNYAHDKIPLELYIEGQNQETFDLSKNQQLSIFHNQNAYHKSNEEDYTEYIFQNLASHASNPSAVTVDEIILAIQNSGVNYEFVVENNNGYLKIIALHASLVQGLYVAGTANIELGFVEEGFENKITGAGEHSDFIQFHNHQSAGFYSDIIIRNNIGKNNQGQQILTGAGVKNFAMINNLFDAIGEYASGNIIFTIKPWAKNNIMENILVEFNTIFDDNNQLSFRKLDEINWINTVTRNNLIGPSGGPGWPEEPLEPGLEVNHNLYDIWTTRDLNLGSLDINPDNTKPSNPSILFSDVQYELTERFGYDYIGGFNLAPNSPAIGFATSESGITYDLDFNPRDSQPDAGAYEYQG